jgi:RNA polymerase sigma factor (sigma-70 family)
MASIVVNSENCLSVEDAELLKGCLENNRLAQHKLYNKYAKRMMAVCYRYSKSLEEAEDTLNEGFMRVFDKLNTFKATGSLEGWIRKVIVNVAIEKFRRTHNPDVKMVNVDDAKYAISSNREEIHSHINAKELIKLVHKLSPVYQMVFNLYVFEDLSHKEISQQLGISEGTSKSNLHDAREWLKKNIEEKEK